MSFRGDYRTPALAGDFELLKAAARHKGPDLVDELRAFKNLAVPRASSWVVFQGLRARIGDPLHVEQPEFWGWAEAKLKF